MENKEQILEEFIDKLVEEKGLLGLDGDVLNQVKEDLLDRLEDRINAAILENMPEGKMKEFDALLDGANEKEIQEFCSDNIENLDDVIAEALIRFREAYLKV